MGGQVYSEVFHNELMLSVMIPFQTVPWSLEWFI